MNRCVKFLILTGVFLLLCGCEDWNDIYSEYGDILDNGFSCNYTLVDEAGPGSGIERIDFSGNNEGIYASYNGGSKELLINSNNEYNTFHIINDYYLYYNNFDYMSFLNQYSQTNTCPSNLYIYIYGSDYYIDDICPSDQICFTYSTRSTSGNNQSANGESGDDAKCHVASAITCKTYYKELDGENVYLELGYETLSDGSAGRYIIVTDNRSMQGGTVARDSSGLATTWKQDTYMVMNPENIYTSSNGSYSFADIKINMNTAGYSQVYYIYAVDDNDNTYGDFEQGAANEYKPQSENVISEAEDLIIEEIHFCEESGVQTTFQIVGYLLFAAKIVVPLLLIILGSIDFAKATISSDDKAPKEALMSFIRRVLIAVIIFFIPTILNFLLSLVYGATEAFSDDSFESCTDCLFDPFGDCKAN